MYCKHCGMESDNDRVCSWCKRPIAAPQSAAPPAPAQPTAGPPPPPPPPPLATAPPPPPPPSPGGMARLGDDEPVADLLSAEAPAPAPTPWQAPAPPPSRTPMPPPQDDLPAVPELDLAAVPASGRGAPGVEVSGPAARRLPLVAIFAIPVLLALAVAALFMGKGSYTPMKPVSDYKSYTDPHQFLTVEVPARWRAQASGSSNRNVLWVFAESSLIEAALRRDDYFYVQTDSLRAKASMMGVDVVQLAHRLRVTRMRERYPGLKPGAEGEAQVDGHTAYYTEFSANKRSLLKKIPLRGMAFTWMEGDVGLTADFTCPARDFATFKPIVEHMMSTLDINL